MPLLPLRSKAIAVAVATWIATFATGDSEAANPKFDDSVISEYVISHKHWRADDFRIERKECDCAYALYWIIYLPEARKPMVGGGKSFAVYYDSERHKVVKEMHFQ